MSHIIGDLRTNEELYSNLDVEWRADYQVGDHKNKDPKQLVSRQRKGRYVRQGELLFVDYEAIRGDGEKQLVDRRRIGFDGFLTRSLEEAGGKTANVVNGYPRYRSKVASARDPT